MKLSLFALCLMAGAAVISAHVTHHVHSNKHIISDGFGHDHIDHKVTTDPISGHRIVERIPHTYTANKVRPIVEVYHGAGHFSPFSTGSSMLRRGGRYNRLGGRRFNRFNRRNRFNRLNRFNRFDRYDRYDRYDGGLDLLHLGGIGHSHGIY